jgi:hypothetical protein
MLQQQALKLVQLQLELHLALLACCHIFLHGLSPCQEGVALQ